MNANQTQGNESLPEQLRAHAEFLRMTSLTGSDFYLAANIVTNAADEIERLNKWADGFSDAQLQERANAEAYQRELREALEAAVEWGRGMEEAPVRDRPRWYDIALRALGRGTAAEALRAHQERIA